METNSLVRLFWEEMGLLLLLLIPILMMIAAIGHQIANVIARTTHHRSS